MTAEDFCRVLESECGVAPGAHVLAAVSGGADSVAMLCLLVQARERMNLRVSCAHVEHGIRGKQSVEDMEFVRELCVQKNTPFYARHVDAPAYARENGCGLEDAARRLRYAFLEETALRIGADVIAVAHHAGDQAETVLMHAARGSDLRGLCAMRFRSGRLIRPLLGEEPQQLRSYLTAAGQRWREDATNGNTDYVRNRIRHRVLSELRSAYPGVQRALSRLALCAQRDEDFISGALNALDIPIIPLVDGVATEISRLRGLHPALASRMLVRLMQAAGAQPDSRVIDSLLRALAGEEASAGLQACSIDGDVVQVRMGKRYLCVCRPDAQLPDTPLSMEGLTHTPLGTFEVRTALEGETGDGVACQAVAARLLEGACIGTRRSGDAMIPFGQHTPVKVKKLMIDAGVERSMRRSIPLLRSGAGVVWMVGLRPGELCRAGVNEEKKMIIFRGGSENGVVAQCANMQKKPNKIDLGGTNR